MKTNFFLSLTCELPLNCGWGRWKETDNEDGRQNLQFNWLWQQGLVVREQLRYWGHSVSTRWGSNGRKAPWAMSLQEETWSPLVLMFSKIVLVSFYFSLLQLHVITLLHLTNVNSFLIWCFWTGYMMFNDQKEVLHGLSICTCTISLHRLIHLQNNHNLCFCESFVLDVFTLAFVFGIMW